MNTQIELTQFQTNLWRAAHTRRPRLEYDDIIDTLTLYFVEVAQPEIIVTHYIDEYVFLLFKNSDHEIVGMGIEGFQRGFAPIYANAAAWKLSSTGAQLNGVTDLAFSILEDEETQFALKDELARRKPSYRAMTNNAVSGLLRCSICGATLWHTVHGRKENRGTAWRCSVSGAKHLIIADQIIINNLAKYVIADISRESETPGSATTALTKEIADLKAARARIDEAYISGLFDLEKSTLLAAPIDTKLTTLENRLRDQQMLSSKALARSETITALRQHQATISIYFENAAPQELQRILNRMYASVTVNPAGEIINAELQNA